MAVIHWSKFPSKRIACHIRKVLCTDFVIKGFLAIIWSSNNCCHTSHYFVVSIWNLGQLKPSSRPTMIGTILVTLTLFGTSLASDHQYPDGLIVETVLKATDCDRPATRGDMLSMHYRGTLEADGSEFDSRWVMTALLDNTSLTFSFKSVMVGMSHSNSSWGSAKW